MAKVIPTVLRANWRNSIAIPADWNLAKPKFHKPGYADPAPDSPEYASDVICSHGALSANTASREQISFAAMELLQGIFPTWNPIRDDVESCAICEVNLHMEEEGKKKSHEASELERVNIFSASPCFGVHGFHLGTAKAHLRQYVTASNRDIWWRRMCYYTRWVGSWVEAVDQ